MHFFRQFVWAEKLTASMFLHVWWKSEMRNMFMKVICWFMKVILQLQLEKHFVRTKFGQQENNVKIMLTLTDAHCTTTRIFWNFWTLRTGWNMSPYLTIIHELWISSHWNHPIFKVENVTMILQFLFGQWFDNIVWLTISDNNIYSSHNILNNFFNPPSTVEDVVESLASTFVFLHLLLLGNCREPPGKTIAVGPVEKK